MSVTSIGSAHPLRQTSFPPDEASQQPQAAFSPSFRGRSPSVDTMSLVSGSQVSTAPVKKKRGRKSKAQRENEAAAAAAATRDATPSLVDGRAGTEVSGVSGKKGGGGAGGGEGGEEGGEGEGEFELPENMASKAAHRSKEQIKEEERLRALVSRHMDRRQFVRYEVWHGATLRMADVKRVGLTSSLHLAPAKPMTN